MRKLLFSVAFVATNFAFGQITLEHSFPNGESVLAYHNDETLYISHNYFSQSSPDNMIKIYNADFSLRKIISVPVPTDFTSIVIDESNEFSVSKNVFNTDDKYEFLVGVATPVGYKLILINEDGQLIKDFHPKNDTIEYYGYTQLFNDKTNNINKLIVCNKTKPDDRLQFDVYLLPTSILGNKEIQMKGKLSAFPIPANKILNVINPQNGSNKIEIFDTTGKLVVNKSFGASENKIAVDVENLPKGNYIYRIGDLSSKFIKN